MAMTLSSNNVCNIIALDSEGFYNVEIKGLGTVECRVWDDRSIVTISRSSIPANMREIAEELARLSLLAFLDL